MAGLLNSVYLVVVVLIAVAGSLFVASVDSESSPRWLELGSVLVVLGFLLAMGAQFLA